MAPSPSGCSSGNSFWNSSDMVAVNSALVRQAAYCVPVMEVESGGWRDIGERPCSGTRKSLSTSEELGISTGQGVDRQLSVMNAIRSLTLKEVRYFRWKKKNQRKLFSKWRRCPSPKDTSKKMEPLKVGRVIWVF